MSFSVHDPPEGRRMKWRNEVRDRRNEPTGERSERTGKWWAVVWSVHSFPHSVTLRSLHSSLPLTSRRTGFARALRAVSPTGGERGRVRRTSDDSKVREDYRRPMIPSDPFLKSWAVPTHPIPTLRPPYVTHVVRSVRRTYGRGWKTRPEDVETRRERTHGGTEHDDRRDWNVNAVSTAARFGSLFSPLVSTIHPRSLPSPDSAIAEFTASVHVRRKLSEITWGEPNRRNETWTRRFSHPILVTSLPHTLQSRRSGTRRWVGWAEGTSEVAGKGRWTWPKRWRNRTEPRASRLLTFVFHSPRVVLRLFRSPRGT